jgi:hypothetical protein
VKVFVVTKMVRHEERVYAHTAQEVENRVRLTQRPESMAGERVKILSIVEEKEQPT